MGIRFYCPTGHRLNVKDFLAGKTGICPHCAARFVIPLVSELPEGAPKVKPGSIAAGGTNSAPEVAPADQENPLAVALANALADAAPRGTSPAVAFPAVESESPRRTSAQVAVPLGMSAELSARPLVNPPTASTGGGLWPEPVPAIPEPAPIVRPSSRDPIDEFPDAVWYVRPPGGGQYGPAKGNVMRQWMQEGRVAADALVWREGWVDWQLAGPVFPELESAYIGRPGPGVSPDLVAPRVAARPKASATPAAAGPARPRSRTRGKPLAAVIVLTLLVVGLVVGLVIVLSTKPS